MQNYLQFPFLCMISHEEGVGAEDEIHHKYQGGFQKMQGKYSKITQ